MSLNIGSKIVWLDEVDSTNDYAKVNSSRLESGTVIVAKKQTKGKGRLGRSWSSDALGSLYMSVLLKPQLKNMPSTETISQLTLVAGLAAANSIHNLAALEALIKWPNDIVFNGKKLCGILVEAVYSGSNLQCIVVGIGLNVNNESFDEDISNKATSVFLECSKKIPKTHFIKEISRLLNNYFYAYFNGSDFSHFRDEYILLCATLNKAVLVTDYSESSFECFAFDVSNNGSLLVKDLSGKVKEVAFGEVSVRGINGYV